MILGKVQVYVVLVIAISMVAAGLFRPLFVCTQSTPAPHTCDYHNCPTQTVLSSANTRSEPNNDNF
jgi:hypothetical protein